MFRVEIAVTIDHHRQIDGIKKFLGTSDDRLDPAFTSNFLRPLGLRSPDANDAAAVAERAVDVRQFRKRQRMRIVPSQSCRS